MPTLDWIGKKAVINHHHDVPFHLLKEEPSLSVGDPESGNLLVQGDNLLALKALLPYYAGQVKCIYIDPPYNTGNEKWTFNDNVNSPEIRKWLGKVVGKEFEDLSRHDKWLCMMYPRLQLLSKFLANDGVMFVSIDDTELPFLRIIMDELFPHSEAKNRLSCFVWQTDGNFDNQAKIKNCHEYILAYSKRFEEFPPPPVIDMSIGEGSKLFRPEIRNTLVKNGPKNPKSSILLPANFPADFKKGIIPARKNKWPHFDKDIYVNDGKLKNPISAYSGWSSKAICEEFITNGFKPVLDSKGQKTRFVITSTGAIEAVKIRSESQSHVISVIKEVGSTQNMSETLARMGFEFSFPKPVGLISYLISMVSDKSALVLDSFAGSGTTGHAVLELNKKDGGKRRFILVQIPYETDEQTNKDFNICEKLTAKRLEKIINGYITPKTGKIDGLGGGFQYCKLSAPCFDEKGRINPDVKFTELARHVFFAETGVAIGKRIKTDSPLIGINKDTAIYLLYNGILKDKTPGAGNVLTRDLLAKLPKHGGPRIIYGTACRLGKNFLLQRNIIFRQIPYEIRVK